MSIESTMAILYAQTGLAAPIVNAATVGPQAAAAMSRTLAAEMAKQEQQQVIDFIISRLKAWGGEIRE